MTSVTQRPVDRYVISQKSAIVRVTAAAGASTGNRRTKQHAGSDDRMMVRPGNRLTYM